MTRCPQAYLDRVFSLRFEAEGLIERSHFIDRGKGNIKAFCNLNEGLSREIVHLGLDILQNADERSLLVTMVFNDLAHNA
jgi:hypothetical protein